MTKKSCSKELKMFILLSKCVAVIRIEIAEIIECYRQLALAPKVTKNHQMSSYAHLHIHDIIVHSSA